MTYDLEVEDDRKIVFTVTLDRPVRDLAQRLQDVNRVMHGIPHPNWPDAEVSLAEFLALYQLQGGEIDLDTLQLADRVVSIVSDYTVLGPA